MLSMFEHLNPVVLGLLASLAAGLATGIGGLPVLFTRNISKGLLDSLLGFSAGVMLAATSFSLILPAIEAGGGGVKGAGVALAGILLGGLFIDVIDKFFPDTNLLRGPSKNHDRLRKIWLFVLAITIHNFPEGMAVGVGFGDGNIPQGLSLAIAIGLQNMPEGLAVALPFLSEGISPWRAWLVALLSGLVEPLGGLIGAGIVHVARPLLPVSLSFAAGAMLFVISHEIIPKTQRGTATKLAAHMLLVGFVIMMFMDTVLG